MLVIYPSEYWVVTGFATELGGIKEELLFRWQLVFSLSMDMSAHHGNSTAMIVQSLQKNRSANVPRVAL